MKSKFTGSKSAAEFKGKTLDMDMGMDVLHDDRKKTVMIGIYGAESLTGTSITIDRQELNNLHKLVNLIYKKWNEDE